MTIGKTAELGKTVWKKNVDGTDDNLCQPQVDYLVYYYIEPPPKMILGRLMIEGNLWQSREEY